MKYILSTLALIVALLILGLYNYGLFHTVTFEAQENKPYILVYEKYVGPYKNVGFLMEKIAQELTADSIPFTKRFGIYYDNPREVPEAELRSLVGCALEGVDSMTLVSLAEKYDLAEYPATPSVITEFPFNGQVSILIGILKVYSPLTDYLNEKEFSHGPIMELYDEPNKVITYITPQKADKIFYDALLGIYEL